jgi:competence protein ComEA
MNPSARQSFVWRLLVKAEVVEDLTTPSAKEPPDESGSVRTDRDALPWHWPLGSRRLLAILFAAAAVYLLASHTENSSDPRPGKVVPDLVLDANTAPARVLGALPHVGPALVRNWTAAREFRPFLSLDDLEKRVKGLGPVGMRRLAPHVRVEGAAEVSTATFEETEQMEPAPKKRASRRKTSRKPNLNP